MGLLFYRIFTGLYFLSIWVSSLFNAKAKLWVKGRRGIFKKIKTQLADKGDNRIWIHCASLGEFEQARPLIEKLKAQDTSFVIIVTFFSPSGYEVRKNYELADAIFYLPADNYINAHRFFKHVKPTKVYFVKYEFWYYFLSKAFNKNIPVYLVSGLFRENQVFFKWYGGFYKKLLKRFNHLFVQNQASADLLIKHGITKVTVSGDTRFDRVSDTAAKVHPMPSIADFKGKKKLLVLGSSWEPEEEIIEQFINEENPDIKVIIAPHDISLKHIHQIQGRFKDAIVYSRLSLGDVKEASVMIIDNIGLLSSIYQYADFAFVGGGFGSGLHNILEPAAFNMPIIFGHKTEKFPEAKTMIEIGAGFQVSTYTDFKQTMLSILNNQHIRQIAREACKNYVQRNVGATNKILEQS